MAEILSPYGTSVVPSQKYQLAIMTFDPFGAADTVGNAAETLVLVLAQAQQSAALGHLGTWVATAGATPGPGVNRLAIYSQAGTLLGQTADMTAAFETTGYIEGALTASVPVTAGASYYLGLLNNFTGTSAAVLETFGLASYPVIRGNYPVVASFGNTTLPASVTPAAMTLGGTALFLTGGT